MVELHVRTDNYYCLFMLISLCFIIIFHKIICLRSLQLKPNVCFQGFFLPINACFQLFICLFINVETYSFFPFLFQRSIRKFQAAKVQKQGFSLNDEVFP